VAELSDVNAKKSFRIMVADHTGITVSNLDRSLAGWMIVSHGLTRIFTDSELQESSIRVSSVFIGGQN